MDLLGGTGGSASVPKTHSSSEVPKTRSSSEVPGQIGEGELISIFDSEGPPVLGLARGDRRLGLDLREVPIAQTPAWAWYQNAESLCDSVPESRMEMSSSSSPQSYTSTRDSQALCKRGGLSGGSVVPAYPGGWRLDSPARVSPTPAEPELPAEPGTVPTLPMPPAGS